MQYFQVTPSKLMCAKSASKQEVIVLTHMQIQ